MSFMEDLELLTEPIALDYDPANYADQPSVPAPPVTGNYEIKLGKYALKKRDGNLVLINGNPLLTIYNFEIVEPAEFAGRKVNSVFQDVFTSTFLRDGKVASGLLDLIRAFDQTRGFSTVNAGLALLDELAGEGRTLKVKLDWTAQDRDYINEQIAAGVDKKAAYKAGEIKSMFKFPKREDGKFNNIWGGIDGTKHIEAKPYIRQFFASLDTVKLGPSGN